MVGTADGSLDPALAVSKSMCLSAAATASDPALALTPIASKIA